uniref:IP17566p1 n=1 Tax=Drosophila melanogaster TaxID=7227 RepID=G4LTZ5_DROME|nr:IP17566p1 [Drosophila melanogaster]
MQNLSISCSGLPHHSG